MKKFILTMSLLTTITSFSSYAIVDGTAASREDNQSYISMSCTGTVLGGKWILTAAHCSERGNRFITSFNGQSVQSIANYEDPKYRTDDVDVGIMELPEALKINTTGFVSMDEISSDELVTIYGFGGTGEVLNYAVQKTVANIADTLEPHYLYTEFINQGYSTYGDSGSAYLDSNGLIRAVATANGNSQGIIGTRLNYARDFILDTINGWSYPTQLKITTSQTIKVQSLHRGGTVDSSYTTGDATIDYNLSTCDDALVNEYEICTYSISSNGGYGQVFLSSDEMIELNEVNPNSKPSTGGGSGGGSGGSTGMLSLLAMGLFGFLRRKPLTK